MEDGVKIPVDIVVDVDMDSIKDNTVTASLGMLSAQIKKVFSSIDPSKLNKDLTTAMGAVERNVRKGLNAVSTLKTAMINAGKSSDLYKAKMRELSNSIKTVQANLAESERLYNMSNRKSPELLAYIEELKAQLAGLIEEQKNVNPMDFIDSAQPENVERIRNLMGQLKETLGGIKKANENWNTAVDDNKLSDEFSKDLQHAEKLKEKLQSLNAESKQMEKYGATEKAWGKMRDRVVETKKELDEVVARLRDAVKTGAAFRFGSGNKGELQRKLNSFAMTAQNINSATAARAERNTSPYTPDYQNKLDELDELQRKLDSIDEKTKKLYETGTGSPRQFVSLKYDADQLNEKIRALAESLRQLINGGNAFKSGVAGNESAELSKMDKILNDVSDSMANITKRSDEKAASFKGETNAVKDDSSSVNKLGKTLNTVSSIISIMNRLLSKGTKRFKLFGKSGKATGDALGKTFKKLFKNVLMYGLGFRTAYYAIRRIRTLFIQEFKLLAKSSDDINNQVSRMVEVFNKLKGSLVTAFQPIATVVIPLLKTFMTYLTSLLETIGKFNATLTGQNYIYKAVAKSVNFAADSMKKANKELGSYDKLEVINKQESDSNDLGITYEKADIEGAASEFAKLIKEAWAKQDFTDVGRVIGEKLVEALNSINWEKIRKKAKGIANSLATLINGFFAVEGLGKSIGRTLAGAILTAIDFMYKTITTIDFGQIGKVIGDAINKFFEDMAVKDEGLSGWGKLAKSLSGLVTGILEFLINAINTVEWDKVGQAIGDFISNIDWGRIIIDLSKLAWSILKALGEAFLGLGKENPAAAALLTVLGINLLSRALMKKFLEAAMGALEIVKLFVEFKKLGGGNTSGTTPDRTASDVDTLNTNTSTLTTKLTTLVKNLALGLVVIAEVAVAAGLIVTAILGLGILLQQVGKAWQPVIKNAGTVAIAIGIGAGLLAVIGVVTALLGSVGATLIVNLALGTAMLALIGVSALLFTTEIWAIGKSLEQIGVAWQPVLDNGDTIRTAILVGTGLLVGIGTVAAALGVATVASVGLLPLAIGLGTLMLVELCAAVIAFCDSLIKVANKLQELAVALISLISFLPSLRGNMDSFTDFMKEFALAVVKFTTANAIASIAATIDKVIGIFTTDPIKRMYDEVTTQATEFGNLIPALEKINPLIKKATELVGEYKSNMGSFESATGGKGGLLGSIIKGAKGVINGLISMFEGMVNGVIRCINALIRGLNKISFNVPDWVPGIGGKKLGFNISEISKISIPRLAKGAVIPPNKEFLAMLGDQKKGTNIEAPLDTIKQAVAEVIAQMGGLGGQQGDINLIVNGRQIAQAVWDEEEKRYKQTGNYKPYYA